MSRGIVRQGMLGWTAWLIATVALVAALPADEQKAKVRPHKVATAKVRLCFNTKDFHALKAAINEGKVSKGLADGCVAGFVSVMVERDLAETLVGTPVVALAAGEVLPAEEMHKIEVGK